MSFSRDANGRLRAVWRVAGFTLVFIAAIVLLQVALAAIPDGAMPSSVRDTFGMIATVAACLVATHVMLRFVEHRPWSMVMLGRDALDRRSLLLATVAGALAIGVPSLLLYASGWLSRVPAPSGSWIGAAFAVTLFLLPAAFAEELLIRGYPFAVIREAAGLPAALLATSVVFGLLHIINPGANAQSLTSVALSGIFLGLLLVVTQSLYAATLAHAAWNWVMAVPLHALVSGNALAAPNYRIVDSGPDWATGGAWGPESGIPASITMLVFVIYLVKAGRAGQLLPVEALNVRRIDTETPGHRNG